MSNYELNKEKQEKEKELNECKNELDTLNNKYQQEKVKLMKDFEGSNIKDRRKSLKKIDELDYKYKKYLK